MESLKLTKEILEHIGQKEFILIEHQKVESELMGNFCSCNNVCRA